MTRRDDRGSVAIVMSAVVAIGLVCSLGLARVTSEVALSAHSQSAADAAALAGVIGGRSLAEKICRANGADLITFDAPGTFDPHSVMVTVDLAGRRARAAASTG